MPNHNKDDEHLYMPGESHHVGHRLRQTWVDKTDFILTAAGLTLGLNNFIRFPYLCYTNDGGSFYLAYLVMMLFCGLPLLCMEYAIGQLAQQGHAALASFCPLLKGFVASSLWACIWIIPIYTTINCWSTYYMIKSLFHTPIWSKCRNPWNSKHCITKGMFPNATQLLIERYKNYFLSKNLNPNYFLTNDGLKNLTSLSALLVNQSGHMPVNNFNLTTTNITSANLNNSTALLNGMRNYQNLQANIPSQSNLQSNLQNNLLAILTSGNLTQIQKQIQSLPVLTNLPENYPNIKNLQNLTYLINFASNLTSDPTERNNKTSFIYNSSYYATQEFFDMKLNGLNTSWSNLGFIKWEFAIPLFVIWITIFICLRKHLTFSRHSTNCLAILPFIFIFILVIRAVMLPGAKIGITFLFQPTLKGLLNPKVWLNAAALCFHSIGAVLGTSLSMAKCNKSQNHFLKDAVVVCTLNALAITIIGLIMFSTLGYLAQERDLHITEVIVNDLSVAFITLCEFLVTLPFPTLWAAAFFLLLFFIGTDYQIAFAATLLTTIDDMYGTFIRKNFFHHQLFILLTCMLFIVFNSLFITQKGLLLITSIDCYVTVWLTVILAFIEVVIIGWFYGGHNFAKMIKDKASKQLGFFIPFCWNILTPLLLITILATNMLFFEQLKFRLIENNFFLKTGLAVAIFGLFIIPIYSCIAIQNAKSKGGFLDRLRIACQPDLKSFPENEVLFNDKYASNFEPNYDYSLTFNGLPYPSPQSFQPKLSTVNSEDMNELLKKNNDMENALIEQSKFSYSILEKLDKETMI